MRWLIVTFLGAALFAILAGIFSAFLGGTEFLRSGIPFTASTIIYLFFALFICRNRDDSSQFLQNLVIVLTPTLLFGLLTVGGFAIGLSLTESSFCRMDWQRSIARCDWSLLNPIVSYSLPAAMWGMIFLYSVPLHWIQLILCSPIVIFIYRTAKRRLLRSGWIRTAPPVTVQLPGDVAPEPDKGAASILDLMDRH